MTTILRQAKPCHASHAHDERYCCSLVSCFNRQPLFLWFTAPGFLLPTLFLELLSIVIHEYKKKRTTICQLHYLLCCVHCVTRQRESTRSYSILARFYGKFNCALYLLSSGRRGCVDYKFSFSDSSYSWVWPCARLWFKDFWWQQISSAAVNRKSCLSRNG